MAFVEVPSIFVRTNLIVTVFVLVIQNSTGASFAEVNRNKGITHSKDGKPSEGIPSSSTLIIPAEGGIVRITREWMFHRKKNRTDNATVKNEVATKLNSNSIKIPDEGGPVHLDFPDYVKYGNGKKKNKISTDELTNVASKGSEQLPVPGNVTAVHGIGKLRSENSTQVIEEASSLTSEQPVTRIYLGNSDYPFFAAVHALAGGEVNFDNVRCSGGIVSRTVVATSCSCLYGDGWPAPPFLFYYVSVGHQKFANINDTQTYHVSSVKYHPSCKKTETGLWKGNVAMLVINKPGIKFNNNVQPMNLPKLKMWDASDILATMSDQRRHCRVIGWSPKTPLIATALGKLIPLDECANPVCRKHLPCPRRNSVDGFMVEITSNEPPLLPGALLYCSKHVFAIVNTKRECPTNNVFASCSPEELLFTKFNFEMTPEAHGEMTSYNNTFLKSIVGWETYSYPPTIETTTAAPPSNSNRQEIFAGVFSSGSILFPFYESRGSTWIYTFIIVAGYNGFVFD